MAGAHYLIFDPITGFLTHLTDDPTVASEFTSAGAAVRDWPSTVFPTMALVPANPNSGGSVPALVGVSGANLPVKLPTSGTVVSSGGATSGTTTSAVTSGGTTA